MLPITAKLGRGHGLDGRKKVTKRFLRPTLLEISTGESSFLRKTPKGPLVFGENSLSSDLHKILHQATIRPGDSESGVSFNVRVTVHRIATRPLNKFPDWYLITIKGTVTGEQWWATSFGTSGKKTCVLQEVQTQRLS